MEKRIFKVLLSLILIFTVCFSITIIASAESGTTNIGFSSKTVNTNSNVVVTITFTAPSNTKIYGGVEALLKYDKEKLNFVSGNNVNDLGTGIIKVAPTSDGNQTKVSATITFKAKNVGSAYFEIYNGIADGFEVPSDNAAISIVAPTKSSDNTLKKLTVGAGTLTPAFSKYVTEYKVTVPYNIDYFNIDAVKNHSGASVSYSSGDKGPKIKVGTTVRTVTVTAENGAVKKYNITVTRLAQDATSSATSSQTSSETSSDTSSAPETNPLDVIVNGSEMKVSEDLSAVEKPAGLELGEYEYNGVNVPAFNNKAGTIIALYLIGEGNSGLYLYKPATDTFEPLCVLSSSAQFIILSVNTITEGDFTFDTENVFSLSTVNVNGNEVPAYIYKDEKLSDFAVVCAQNSAGEMGYYTYDISEGTLQRYNAQADIVKADKDVSGGIIAINDTVVVLGCFALTVIAIIAIIIVWAVRKKREKDEAAIESTSTQDAVFDWENEVIVGDDFADTQSDEDAKLDFEAFFEEQKNELNSDQEDEKNTDEPENEE